MVHESHVWLLQEAAISAQNKFKVSMSHLHAILPPLSAGDAWCPAIWLCLRKAAAKELQHVKRKVRSMAKEDKPIAPYS